MISNLSEVSNNIRAKRIELGMTTQELSFKSKISVKEVEQVESGKQIECLLVQSILDALGFTSEIEINYSKASTTAESLQERR